MPDFLKKLSVLTGGLFQQSNVYRQRNSAKSQRDQQERIRLNNDNKVQKLEQQHEEF